MSDIIFGRNPVLEAMKSGREIEKLLLQKNAEGSAKRIEAIARDKRITIQHVDKAALDRILKRESSGNHQGVVAYAATFKYHDIDYMLEKASAKGEEPFLVVLDGIEDPHNLGSIVRSAEGAGVHGVIIPKRRAVSMTGVAVKASAGAAEYVPVARVTNLARTIEQLKERGLWIAASHMDGRNYYDAELAMPIALIIGNEGKGISKLLLDKCDYLLSIPMSGRISSLNASNAASVLMYEIKKQKEQVRFNE